jgi:glyoxylase-like metal-dependent hydrolase (beta-lactamase superfamily II)
VRIHHINCGTMCPIGGRLLFYHGGSPPDQHRLVCQCLLIETDRDGLVLVDTGFGLRDVTQPHERLSAFFRVLNGIRLDENQTALLQVQRLGYSAKDVRHIVLTHLDFDHAGGIEDFPHALVHVAERELSAAMNGRKSFIARRRYRPQQWDEPVRWQTYEPGGERWFGFPAVRALTGLPPEILLVPLIGHTFGHCGIAIATGNGWLLHAGDAYFDTNEMRTEGHRCTPGLRFYQTMMEVDREARLANQERLRALRCTHDSEVKLFCSHDAAEFDRLRAASARRNVEPRYERSDELTPAI